MPTLTHRQQQVFSALFEFNESIESVSADLKIDEAMVRRHRDAAAKKLEAVRS
jgi:FixJ family two-component response regulator